MPTLRNLPAGLKVAAVLATATATSAGSMGTLWPQRALAASTPVASYSFETGTTEGWTGTGSSGAPVLSAVTTPTHAGSGALHAVFPGAALAGAHTGGCGATSMIAGQTYTATVWAMSATRALRLRLPGHVTSPARTVPSTAYQSLTWTFTAPTTNGRLCVVTEDATSPGDSAVIDDLLVVAGGAAPASAVTKVITIVAENHSLAQMRNGMPYTAALADQYAYATSYTAIRHPSLPNYLALTGGDTFGVSDDAAPASHVIRGMSIFGQVASSKTYAESMTSNCQLTSSGRYAVKHNPQAYFADERSKCQTSNVPLGTATAGALHDDIANGALPTVSAVIPNLCNDAHDCPLSTADAWIHGWTQQLMAGPDYRAGRLAIIITADEDDSSSGNLVMTTVVHPSLSHRVATTPLTHYSLLGFYADVAGAGSKLRAAASAPSFRSAFGL